MVDSRAAPAFAMPFVTGAPSRSRAQGMVASGFDRLFAEEYPRVAAIARRIVGDPAAAEDVAQEVFLALHRRFGDDPGAGAPGWLHAAAAHAALNTVRGDRRRSAREERFMTAPGEDTGGTYNGCKGPYETAGGPEGAESGDALCYHRGDTHPGYAGAGTSTAPDEATGCQDNVFQNGDLDFDGSPYWTEWPTSTTAGKYPGSFVEWMPTTRGNQYAQYGTNLLLTLGYPEFEGPLHPTT